MKKKKNRLKRIKVKNWNGKKQERKMLKLHLIINKIFKTFRIVLLEISLAASSGQSFSLMAVEITE